MATKGKKRRRRVKRDHPYFRKVMAGFALLSLIVLFIAGITAGVELPTLLMRAFLVYAGIWLISVVVTAVLNTYEEMSGG